MTIIRTLPTPTEQYRCKIEFYERFGAWGAMFILVHAKGALHYHVSSYESDGVVNYSSGLECHYRTPPDYMANRPPSHDVCHILKCPCWHDGTSLYASEKYEPMFIRGDYNGIIQQLKYDADNYFGRKELQ